MRFLKQLRKKVILNMRVKRTLQTSKAKESATNNSAVGPMGDTGKASYVEPDSVMPRSGNQEVQTSDGSSDSQKTLPDTQPVDSDATVTSTLDFENNQSDEVWACLLARNKHFSTVAVKKNTFRCGRAGDNGNDYTLTEPLIPKDCIDQYSRTHFVVEKLSSCDTPNKGKDILTTSNDLTNDGTFGQNDDGLFDDNGDFDVYLTDCSQNGTYVNGELVGKWKRRPLVNNDIIALTAPNREAFRFCLVDNSRAKSGNYSGSSDGTTNYTDGFLPVGGGISNGIDASGTGKQYPDQLTDKYIVGRLLGTGSCGSVYLGYAKPNVSPDYTKVAIKIIKKTSLGYKYYNLNSQDTPTDQKRTITEEESEENLRVEVEIMEKLSKATGHPCIVRMEDVFDLPHVLIIVLELAEGGELFKYVLADFNNETFDERIAKLQFYQILSGIEYLHDNRVCHRDIKLENILMAEKKKSSLVKITDFGLSKLLDDCTMMASYVGTPSYIAPEVLKNGMCVAAASKGQSAYVASRGFETYTVKADMWSLGCILYSLLCGSSAFDNHNQEKMRSNILQGRFSMEPRCNKVWAVVTSDAVDLVKKLLTVDPNARLSASEALQHPWFLKDPHVVQKAKDLMSEGQLKNSYSISSKVGMNRLTIGSKPKFENHRPDMRNNVSKVMPINQPGAMAPPPFAANIRKRVAPAATESMDIEDEFTIPGTQNAAISLLDLRPRKRNKEDRAFP